jgi:aromatic-L-amino-acid decarboxylase
MDPSAFRKWSRRAADWGADYREGLRKRPVRAPGRPGDVARKLETSPPETAEPMEVIFEDFETIIVPGMTHWQHPRFFAYFPANAAPVSVVAEYLVSTIAAQCMLWQTSPAATELETVALDWLRQALGLANGFSGVIQDSASSATLAAVLTMRERALGWRGKSAGLAAHPPVRVYASDQAHSSIDRAIWISGIGEDNLVRIATTGPSRGMDALALDAAIASDKAAGLIPAGIIANVGGTSIGASDDVAAVSAVARHHDLYLHVDAAWAGSAMICPEFRHYWAGIDDADSLVLNPHQRPGGHGRLQRMVDPARPALPGTEAVVPDAGARAGGAEGDDPQPCGMGGKVGAAARGGTGFRTDQPTDAVALLVPLRAAGGRGLRWAEPAASGAHQR